MKLFNPKVSFVVPVFNVKPYLEKCLESIIRTNVEKEIILVDDGSTDGSQDILKKYQEKYPYITLVLQKNRGVSVARNIGIRLAKGEYIQFVDSDDFLLYEDYKTLVSIVDKSNADLVRGQYLWEMPDGQMLQVYSPVSITSYPEDALYVTVSGEFFLERYSHSFPAVWLGFYRTEMLRKYHIFFEENLSASEDHIFLLDILTQPNLTVIEVLKPIYGYRYNPLSLSNRKNNVKFVEDIFKACNLLRERHRGKNPTIYKIIHQAIMGQYAMVYNSHYCKFTDENKQKVRHLFTSEIIRDLESYLGEKLNF